MSHATYELTLQLLRFIAERPRTHAEVLEAWRTSCPRLSIWEDAYIDGLIERDSETTLVTLSAKGASLLSSPGRGAA